MACPVCKDMKDVAEEIDMAMKEQEHFKERVAFKGEGFIMSKQLVYKWIKSQTEKDLQEGEAIGCLLSKTGVPCQHVSPFGVVCLFFFCHRICILYICCTALYCVSLLFWMPWFVQKNDLRHLLHFVQLASKEALLQSWWCSILPPSESYCTVPYVMSFIVWMFFPSKVTFQTRRNRTWLKGIFWAPTEEVLTAEKMAELKARIEVETKLSVNGVVGAAWSDTMEEQVSLLGPATENFVWVHMPATSDEDPKVYQRQDDGSWVLQDLRLIMHRYCSIVLYCICFGFKCVHDPCFASFAFMWCTKAWYRWRISGGYVLLENSTDASSVTCPNLDVCRNLK